MASGEREKRTWKAVPGRPAAGPNQRRRRSGSSFRCEPTGWATLQNSFTNRKRHTSPFGKRTSVSPKGRSGRVLRDGSLRMGSRWFHNTFVVNDADVASSLPRMRYMASR